MFNEKDFQILLPLACQWAEAQEQIILRDGVPLSAIQINDAKTIGVAHPEKVRLLAVPAVPRPEHPALQAAWLATIKIFQ